MVRVLRSGNGHSMARVVGLCKPSTMTGLGGLRVAAVSYKSHRLKRKSANARSYHIHSEPSPAGQNDIRTTIHNKHGHDSSYSYTVRTSLTSFPLNSSHSPAARVITASKRCHFLILCAMPAYSWRRISGPSERARVSCTALRC